MANLSVRNLDDKTYISIRLRAAAHRVSMEEEVRQILSQAAGPALQISQVFRKNFGVKNGITLNIQREAHETMSFDE